MVKKFSPEDPNRPRNVIKRQKREQREQHKRLMKQKEEAMNKPDTEPAKDSQKTFHASHVKEVKDYIKRLNKKIKLPFAVDTLRKGKVSDVLVINIDGRAREILPDVPAKHKILCHGNVARVITSGMCVFAKITQHERIDAENGREWIDGSWTIAPCSPAMLNGTTVQHVRRRKWFFLHKYWYEISFDGRVQPASLFYDYDVDPLTPKRRFYVTHEYIQVRNSNVENDYFRFWKNKIHIK